MYQDFFLSQGSRGRGGRPGRGGSPGKPVSCIYKTLIGLLCLQLVFVLTQLGDPCQTGV